MKLLIIGSMIIFTYAGNYVPTLFGAGYFSMIAIFTGAIGGIAGIYIGFKLAQFWGLE